MWNSECERSEQFNIKHIEEVNDSWGRFSGVVVIVLATGLKCCGFEPSQGEGFLMDIKIRSTPFFRMVSKAGGPMS
jgi:hypothetical protein